MRVDDAIGLGGVRDRSLEKNLTHTLSLQLFATEEIP